LIPFGLSDFAMYCSLLFAVEVMHFDFTVISQAMWALAMILLCIFMSCLVSRDHLLIVSLDRATKLIAMLYVIIGLQDSNL